MFTHLTDASDFHFFSVVLGDLFRLRSQTSPLREKFEKYTLKIVGAVLRKFHKIECEPVRFVSALFTERKVLLVTCKIPFGLKMKAHPSNELVVW